jgi:hypothetical protein
MKNIMIAVLVLLFSVGVSAQEPSTQTPPVGVVKASYYVPSCRYGYGKCFSVTYRNDSDKEVRAVEFNVVFVDTMGDKHTYAHTFLAEGSRALGRPIKPGKTGEAIWDNVLYDYCRKYEVTVVKVAFKDGTVWKASSVTSSSRSQTYLDGQNSL